MFQEKFEEGAKRLKDVRNMEDFEILKNADVVGMTTTGKLCSFASNLSSDTQLCLEKDCATISNYWMKWAWYHGISSSLSYLPNQMALFLISCENWVQWLFYFTSLWVCSSLRTLNGWRARKLDRHWTRNDNCSRNWVIMWTSHAIVCLMYALDQSEFS